MTGLPFPSHQPLLITSRFERRITKVKCGEAGNFSPGKQEFIPRFLDASRQCPPIREPFAKEPLTEI